MPTCSKRRRASLPPARLEDRGDVAAGDHTTHLVQLGGLEPPTSWSTAKRSNQLSYSCTRRGRGRNLGARSCFDKVVRSPAPARAVAGARNFKEKPERGARASIATPSNSDGGT